MNARTLGFAAIILLLGGCAVRLGGSGPEEFQTLALNVPAGESAEQAAGRITAAGADIVLLTAARDSAWFADVASRAQLSLSGPGRAGELGMGFLTRRLEILGDTSIALNVRGGGRVHMHDALYQLSGDRLLDLMLIHLEGEAELREAVRTLLSYIATDVGANAAVVFALNGATPQAADSAAVLLRAAYGNAWECARASGEDGESRPVDLRLFYGPSVRMRCQSARVLAAPGNPIAAQLVVGR